MVMDDIQGWVNLNWSPSIALSSLCCLSLLLWFMAIWFWFNNFSFSFFFRSCPWCWHVVQSRGSFIMSFRSSREVPCGSIWLVASFQWLGLSPINSGIPLLPSHISYIFSSDLCRLVPSLGVSVFSHPRLDPSILFFSSLGFFSVFQNVWNHSVFV